MTTNHDPGLYRLLTWLSPSYPVGAFSYSQGLETAIARGLVADTSSLQEWIESSLSGGTLWSDAVLFARAHEAASTAGSGSMRQVVEVAAAFQPSAELRIETMAQGDAFLKVTMQAWPCAAFEKLTRIKCDEIAYPVAVGCAAAGHGIGLNAALDAWLHAAVSNLVSAAIRLVPLGHTRGQEVLASVEPAIAEVTELAQEALLRDMATNNFAAEICSMRHETQTTRLFRS
ncbi:MAG: urease accessory protein UreF [Pseudomonadota bacterium]